MRRFSLTRRLIATVVISHIALAACLAIVGILRDQTGSFAAGFYMVAIADVTTLGLIVLLSRMIRGPMTTAVSAQNG